MSRPKTKDAVNFLVSEAGKLLNNSDATCIENYLYLFSIAYNKIGMRYPAMSMGRMTYIVPDKVSEVHDKIEEIVKEYFTKIENLDFVKDRKTIIQHRGDTKKKLEELKM